MKVHFIGIGGIGVSALARYYLEKGHKVSGSDLVSSEITDALKEKGAKIFIGHNPKCLTPGVKQVIYSPAIQKNNPELKKAYKLQTTRLPAPRAQASDGQANYKLQIMSYPEALGELTKKYFTIAVCGSHGKSTVSAMIGLILTKAKLDPTVILGTKLKEFAPHQKNGGGSNCRVGKGKYLVIEADEYKESFLNYWPRIIVLTTLEPDHLDYYKNFKNYISAFKKFISHLPKNGYLIANKDDKNIYPTFSTIVENMGHYSLRQKEAKKIKKILKVPGKHNVQNALAALAVARALSVPDEISFKALSEYKGSWRRFEVIEADKRGYLRGFTPKITLISDYAHHPTQIKATLEAAKERFSDKKIWVVFQPHQYQRTYYLFKDFVKVLSEAPIDKLIITDIYEVAGRENKKIKKKVSSEKLVKRIMNYELEIRNKIMYIPTIEKAVDYLKKNLKGEEVVIVMGAGDVYKLADLLIDPVRNMPPHEFLTGLTKNK